jgi:hypothetical protein
VKVSLLIALFVTMSAVVAKAEAVDRASPVGSQSPILTYHKDIAAPVSAPAAVAAVRSAGLYPATLPVKIGSRFIVYAVNKRGSRVRVVLDAGTRQILTIRSIALTKRDEVSKSPGRSHAEPKLLRSEIAPALASAQPLSRLTPPKPSANSLPMRILPEIAAVRHQIPSGQPLASMPAAPIRLASNERTQPQLPNTLIGTLRAAGLTPATAPVKIETTYVVQAINRRGMTLRVLLAATSGDILAIKPTEDAPRSDPPVHDAANAARLVSTDRDLPTSEASFIGP